MSKIKLVIFLLIFVFTFLHSAKSVLATGESKPTVTVVNPIRGPQLGLEGRDLLESLEGHWKATKDENIGATWLWQYSALEDDELVQFAKSNMSNQEFGIFLEIDKNFAEKTNVRYRGIGPWFLSDGLFPTSYEQGEREKFITNVFETFRERFGYYPKTVGAWWVGAESIKFMKEKYGVIAVLQCADQFMTDRYSIWGTPWSIPYVPSSINSGIPAQSSFYKIDDVVVIQWAMRDPVNGYGESVEYSTFSIQDYTLKKYDPKSYLEYLRKIYLKRQFDHMVVGLESGFGGASYGGMYQDNLKVIAEWRNEEKVQVQTAVDYALGFIDANIIFPPTSHFLSSGFDSQDQAFWYHSPGYRIGIKKEGDRVYLIDLRDYTQTPAEEFYVLPNTNEYFRINTAAIIDSVRFPEEKVLLFSSDEQLKTEENNGGVSLYAGDKKIVDLNKSKIIFSEVKESEKFSRLSDRVNLLEDGIIVAFDNFRFNMAVLSVIVPLFLYVMYLIYFYRGKVKRLLINFFYLILGIVALYPIYSSGAFFQDAIGFSRFGFQMFEYVKFIPLNPEHKILFIYQIIPISFIIVFHFLVIKFIKKASVILAIYTVLLVLYFAYFGDHISDIQNFFNLGRRAKLIVFAFAALIFGGIWLMYDLFTRKKERTLKLIFIGIVISILFLYRGDIFGHRHYIILPFEMSALEKVYEVREDVLYRLPDFDQRSYQSVTPLLILDVKYMEALTAVEWEVVEKEDIVLELKNRKAKLIFLPRYLGAGMSHADKLEKIFDNGQIAIFKD